MNKEQLEGKWDKTKGKVKDAVGGATDKPGTQAEGKWDKAKGEFKETVGDLKEEAERDEARRR
jgi:uncharacterized protein YjbJ (UPF0337 family)